MDGKPVRRDCISDVPGGEVATSLEIPYANGNRQRSSELGRACVEDLARALRAYREATTISTILNHDLAADQVSVCPDQQINDLGLMLWSKYSSMAVARFLTERIPPESVSGSSERVSVSNPRVPITERNGRCVLQRRSRCQPCRADRLRRGRIPLRFTRSDDSTWKRICSQTKFRESFERMAKSIPLYWPECVARLAENVSFLLLQHALAIRTSDGAPSQL